MKKTLFFCLAAALFGSAVVYLSSHNSFQAAPLLSLKKQFKWDMPNESPKERAKLQKMNNLINDEQFNYKVKSLKDLQ
jgi:hypothetical protein